MTFRFNLLNVVKNISFMILLAATSSGFAADREAAIHNLSRLSVSYQSTEMERAPAIGESSFLQQEQAMIKGLQLNLYGVALFSANDIVGDVIRTLTGFKWSHLGAVLEDQYGVLWLLESKGSADEVLKGIKPQVQISKWAETSKSYNGNVAIRPFIFNTFQPDATAVQAYLDKNLGRSYEKDMMVLIRAISGQNTPDDSYMSSLFCSEMVADLLINLGFWDGKKELASNCLPGHFAAPTAEKYVKLINGASLGHQKIIKRKKRDCCTLL